MRSVSVELREPAKKVHSRRHAGGASVGHPQVGRDVGGCHEGRGEATSDGVHGCNPTHGVICTSGDRIVVIDVLLERTGCFQR